MCVLNLGYEAFGQFMNITDIITEFIDTYDMYNSKIQESAKVLCYLAIHKLKK